MGVEESVYLAKLAEQAERYEGMFNVKVAVGLKLRDLAQKWSRT